MIIKDPGEKKTKILSCYFCRKELFFYGKLDGSSMVLFSSFCVTYFGEKTNVKILPIDLFEAFGRYESDFRTD